MKVDKRIKHLPLVATEPEKEQFRDHLYKLNKARVAAGKRPYSFSRYGIEAIYEKMERDMQEVA